MEGINEMENKLANRIKEAREHANLSQTKLAELIGISYRSVQNYESGLTDPPSQTIVKIADICKVSDIWLLTGSDKEGKFLDHKIVKEPESKYNYKEMAEFLFDENKKKDKIIEDLNKKLRVRLLDIGKVDPKNKKMNG